MTTTINVFEAMYTIATIGATQIREQGVQSVVRKVYDDKGNVMSDEDLLSSAKAELAARPFNPKVEGERGLVKTIDKYLAIGDEETASEFARLMFDWVRDSRAQSKMVQGLIYERLQIIENTQISEDCNYSLIEDVNSDNVDLWSNPLQSEESKKAWDTASRFVSPQVDTERSVHYRGIIMSHLMCNSIPEEKVFARKFNSIWDFISFLLGTNHDGFLSSVFFTAEDRKSLISSCFYVKFLGGQKSYYQLARKWAMQSRGMPSVCEAIAYKQGTHCFNWSDNA